MPERKPAPGSGDQRKERRPAEPTPTPAERPADPSGDPVEEAGVESFPASDPPSWTGTSLA